MSQELIYTSVPRGLKPGSKGFCTVAMSPAMPAALIERLESLSGYRPIFALGSSRVADNPINFSHYRLPSGRSLLSRVAFAGVDYSQRSNKLAHHVVLEPSEQIASGPAWILQQPGFALTEWKGEPHVLTTAKTIPPGRRLPRPAAAWAEASGDAGWAGVLAASFLDNRAKPAYLIYPAGVDVLALFDEAISLLDPASRWQVTFSTYFMTLPVGLDCAWRGIPVESPIAREILRSTAPRLLIDLTQPMPAPPTAPLVLAARTGSPPPAAIAAKSTGPTANPVGTPPDEPDLAGARPGSRRRLTKATDVTFEEPDADADEDLFTPPPLEPPPRRFPIRWVIITASLMVFIILCAALSFLILQRGIFRPIIVESPMPTVPITDPQPKPPAVPTTHPRPPVVPAVTGPPTTQSIAGSDPKHSAAPPLPTPPSTRPSPIAPATRPAPPPAPPAVAVITINTWKLPPALDVHETVELGDPDLPEHWSTADIHFPNNQQSIQFSNQGKSETLGAIAGPDEVTINYGHKQAALGTQVTTSYTIKLNHGRMLSVAPIIALSGDSDPSSFIWRMLKLTEIIVVADDGHHFALSWPDAPPGVQFQLGSITPTVAMPQLPAGMEAYAMLQPPQATPRWRWTSAMDGGGILGAPLDRPDATIEIKLIPGPPAQVSDTYSTTINQLKAGLSDCERTREDAESQLNLDKAIAEKDPGNASKAAKLSADTIAEAKARANYGTMNNAIKEFQTIKPFDVPVVLKNHVQIATIHVVPPKESP